MHVKRSLGTRKQMRRPESCNGSPPVRNDEQKWTRDWARISIIEFDFAAAVGRGVFRVRSLEDIVGNRVSESRRVFAQSKVRRRCSSAAVGRLGLGAITVANNDSS
jgi:hypothetical protein